MSAWHMRAPPKRRDDMIDFNVPPYVGTEMDYVREAAEKNR